MVRERRRQIPDSHYESQIHPLDHHPTVGTHVEEAAWCNPMVKLQEWWQGTNARRDRRAFDRAGRVVAYAGWSATILMLIYYSYLYYTYNRLDSNKLWNG